MAVTQPCLPDALLCRVLFFFNDTATTEIYTLSLHDALPIWSTRKPSTSMGTLRRPNYLRSGSATRSEEHTSELQSHVNLVCRLLLAKNNRPGSARRDGERRDVGGEVSRARHHR